MEYNRATICQNGHVISKYEANSQEFCSICGARSYSACPHCNATIHGTVEMRGIAFIGSIPYDRPNYCYSCGAAYPWTEMTLNNAVELVALDDELDEVSKDLIKNAIPDLIADSPTTPVAVSKCRKGLLRAGDALKNALYNLLIDVLSDTAKKMLFP